MEVATGGVAAMMELEARPLEGSFIVVPKGRLIIVSVVTKAISDSSHLAKYH